MPSWLMIKEMKSWWNGKLVKQLVDEMASWLMVKSMKLGVGEMASWFNHSNQICGFAYALYYSLPEKSFWEELADLEWVFKTYLRLS